MNGDRLAIQISAGFAVALNDAPHDEFLVALDALFLQPLAQRRGCAGKFEGRRDFSPIGAMTDHLGAGSATDRQLQGIDQNRLTRAGFAGEHGEAFAKIEFDTLDDREVTDVQVAQHDESSSAQSIETAAPPVEFAAQQSEVVVTRRMQQRDALRCRTNREGAARG